MKKKLLLGVLPALMVLSACNGAGFKVKDKNLFKESTGACQEIFGKAEVAGELKGRRNSTASDLAYKPIIGVQYRYDDVNDKYAVRYIAAITSLYVKAYWTRGITTITNSPVRPLTGGIESTTAYTSLMDGESPITPAAFAGDEKYEFFITYTMHNIPAEQFSSYMIAYVTLSDDNPEEPDVPSIQSDAKVTQIEEGNEQFTVDSSAQFFLGGKLGGAKNKSVVADDPFVGNNTDLASFSFDFVENDYFYVFKHNPLDETQKFRILGYNVLQTKDDIFGEKSGMITANTTGRRAILYSKENQLYVTSFADVTFTVDMQLVETIGQVKLAGDFTNWSTNAIVMNDDDADKVYSATVSLPIGYQPSFKFINKVGEVETWERVYNRWVLIEGDETFEYNFNDDDPNASYFLNIYLKVTNADAWEDAGKVVYAHIWGGDSDDLYVPVVYDDQYPYKKNNEQHYNVNVDKLPTNIQFISCWASLVPEPPTSWPGDENVLAKVENSVSEWGGGRYGYGCDLT